MSAELAIQFFNGALLLLAVVFLRRDDDEATAEEVVRSSVAGYSGLLEL
jgi:hypothetical protein